MSINGICLTIVAAVVLASAAQWAVDQSPTGSGIEGALAVARSEVAAVVPMPELALPESYVRLALAFSTR
jgi:hypothetical protein